MNHVNRSNRLSHSSPVVTPAGEAGVITARDGPRVEVDVGGFVEYWPVDTLRGGSA